ncbi:hypothetical protein [Algibacter sp. PT7-4]|uniref:hypothetical protein n=1 Tax=Algibacter ulvanivorans TaxID=3400999 RepID=UPI003AAFCCA7
MVFFKQFFNFYINSSIHVGLSVFSLTWITLLMLGLEYNEPVLYFVFYASVTGYNFVKYYGLAKFRHRQLANWLKLIQIVSLICFLLMCYYAIGLNFSTYVFISFFAILTVLYAMPFKASRRKSLRDVSGLKVYVIALVWAGVTVFVPVIDAGYSVNTDIVLLGLQRFVFVLVLMIPFEIRDLKFDNKKLSTIPQKLGVKNAKILGVFLLVFYFLIEFFKDETTANIISVQLLMLVITGALVVFSRVEQQKYYSSFWVESLPIVWLVLLLFFN